VVCGHFSAPWGIQQADAYENAASGSGVIAMVGTRPSSVVTAGRPFELILSSRVLLRLREPAVSDYKLSSAFLSVCSETCQICPYCCLPVARESFVPSKAHDPSVISC
jgi:hypothetical protein